VGSWSFSTETGDPGLRTRTMRFAGKAGSERGGANRIQIKKPIPTFAIGWKGRYSTTGPAFLLTPITDTGRVAHPPRLPDR